MKKCLLLTASLLLFLFTTATFGQSTSNSYYVNQQIPINGSGTYYVQITGAPSNAIITSVRAKFDYIAYNGVQNYVSARFNRGSDPGAFGGQSLVSQGSLPAGNPGSYGYIYYSNWNGQSVNTNYYFRFAVASGSPYTATINRIYVQVTYVVPSINVNTPNGGENWPKGTQQTITWSSSNVTGNIHIQWYKGGTAPGNALSNVTGSTANDGSFTTTVPTNFATGNDYYIGMSDVNTGNIYDFSNSPFTISAQPSITLTNPNGGENWEKGSQQTITWTSTNVSGNVHIQWYKGGTQPQHALDNIAASTSNDGSFTTTVPANYAAGNDYYVGISDYNTGTVYDFSNSPFTISDPPSITLTNPNGGENWEKGSQQTVTWTSVNINGNVHIQWYKGGTQPQHALDNIAASTSNDGSYTTTVPANYAAGNDYYVGISDYNTGTVYDFSNSPFTISDPSSITLTNPNGGENWAKGSQQTITWTSVNVSGNVHIQWYKGGTQPQHALDNIAASTANDGSFITTVPSNYTTGNDYYVGISDFNTGTIFDFSDSPFTISDPSSITLTNPNGGENWAKGSQQTITWTSVNVSGNVHIQWYKGGTQPQHALDNIAASTANDGSFITTVPSNYTTGNDYYVGISDFNTGTIFDFSDSPFTISDPSSITLTNPNGGENWAKGSQQTVTWTSVNVSGNVHIQWYKGGTDPQYALDNIAASTVNDGSFTTTVPSNYAAGNDYYVGISDFNTGTIYDFSENPFTISDPSSLTITNPDGGETWEKGSQQTITWTSVNVSGNVHIQWYKGGTDPQYALDNIAASTVNDGSFTTTVPTNYATGNDYYIGMSDANTGTIYTFSAGPFSITSVTSAASITGVVSDQSTSGLIEDAELILTGPDDLTLQTTTLADGSYQFDDLSFGNYNLYVSADGYDSDNRNINIINNLNQQNFSLTPSGNYILPLTDQLTMNADNVEILHQDHYRLSGNVHINGILYFSGEVTVDKRINLYKPEVSGSGAITIKGIQGQDHVVKSDGLQFKYYAEANDLTPKSYAYIVDGNLNIGGFDVIIGQFVIDENGEEVEIKVMVDMPFPLNRIVKFYQDKHPENPLPIIQEASFSEIFSRINGIDYAGEIDGLSLNAGIFSISEVNIYYDSSQDLFGGGLKLKIPGGIQPSDAFENTGYQDELTDVPVAIYNEEGNLVSQTNFKGFLQMAEFLGASFLEFGMEMEFFHGQLNKLIITIGSKIPLGTTGLYITEMNGGVNDLNQPDWKIIANVDIETQFENSPLGSPLKINDFGVSIAPLHYFEGGGTFQVFEEDVASAFLRMDLDKRALILSGQLDLADMIIGELNASLRSKAFYGSIMGTVKTPSDLPWGFGWAENRVFGSTTVVIENLTLQSEITIWRSGIAQKFEYDPNAFLNFHYYIGLNLGNLDQIWEGKRNGKTSIDFLVGQNIKEVLIVAGNDLNLFDFTVQSPSGNIYDQNNTDYSQFSNSLQTLMLVKAPEAGIWSLSTDQTGDITVEALAFDQPPTILLNNPLTKESRDNNISLSFNDYDDTLHVQVFYDTDRKNFDGVLITEFDLNNNADINFTWQNGDLPNGEYFIYSRINDNKNATVQQYAPGSILVENDLNIETPANFQAIQTGDSTKVSWNQPTNSNTFSAIVYYKNITDNITGQLAVADSNVAYLKDLTPGQEYEIWACFMNENGTISPQSNSNNVIFTDPAAANHPPYFTLNPDSIWTFIEGEAGQFTLSGNDADGDGLSFQIPGNTLGIQINSNVLSWTPTESDKGTHRILLTASDGTALDSVYKQLVVYTRQQVSVDVEFNSLNLFEGDNKFLKIRNFRSKFPTAQVTLTNLSTTQQTSVNCQKVDDFNYIGSFDLSFIENSDLTVSNGDTIEMSYSYGDTNFTAIAYFDSLPQNNDAIAPGKISDLQVIYLGNSIGKLTWTAPGDDGHSGQALKYDIRYAYTPISDEADFLTANLISEYPYPALAGATDTLILDLNSLTNIQNYDTVYFSMKTEDEKLNRSEISNNAVLNYLATPENVSASITDFVNITLNWEGFSEKIRAEISLNEQSTTFDHFSVYRKYNEEIFQKIVDSTNAVQFTDSLSTFIDGDYQYAVQAIFSTGESDTVYSNTVIMDRFTDVRILSVLEDTTQNDSVQVQVNGLDTVYSQSYDIITNPTGLVLLDTVYKGNYAVSLSKNDYLTILDTINVSDLSDEFIYTLSRARIKVQPRVYLEGPFQDSLMSSYLGDNELLPLTQPYSSAPWSYSGSETVSSLPDSIVDWILLEIRTGVTSASTVERQAAFLKSNGDIVGLDGKSLLSFNIPEGSYYMTVFHRNHLAIMSAQQIPLQFATPASYDFTSSQSQVYGFNPMKELGTNIFGLIAGDADKDGGVDAIDRNLYWRIHNGTAWNYSKLSDFNLDGGIDALDINLFWRPNNGSARQFDNTLLLKKANDNMKETEQSEK